MPRFSLNYAVRKFRLVATPPVILKQRWQKQGYWQRKGYTFISESVVLCSFHTVRAVNKCFPDWRLYPCASWKPELWHSVFYIEGKKRVHYMWLPYDKATLTEYGGGGDAILAVAESAGNVHQHNSSVTLRAEIGKPVPFLYFCSFFSTHWKLPPGS